MYHAVSGKLYFSKKRTQELESTSCLNVRNSRANRKQSTDLKSEAFCGGFLLHNFRFPVQAFWYTYIFPPGQTVPNSNLSEQSNPFIYTTISFQDILIPISPTHSAPSQNYSSPIPRPLPTLPQLLHLLFKHAFKFLLLKYLTSIQRTRLPHPWIRAPSKQRLDDTLLVLENGTREWGLAAVVEAVGVCAVSEEEGDERGVAVVGGKHDQLSPLSFVIFGLKPLGKACSKISICPFLAASKNRVANASASGGNWSADAGGADGAESIYFNFW